MTDKMTTREEVLERCNFELAGDFLTGREREFWETIRAALSPPPDYVIFKRYAVVAYGLYYPCGFEDDVSERFKTVEEAKAHILDNKLFDYESCYIFDLVKWEHVEVY